MPRTDPHFRPYLLTPGWPITIEVRCTDGPVALVQGVIDSAPWLAGENALRIVVADARVRPLEARRAA